jgi:hypothetical protein
MWSDPGVLKQSLNINPSAQVLETHLSRASMASHFWFTMSGGGWRQITRCERFKRGKGEMVQVKSPIFRYLVRHL